MPSVSSSSSSSSSSVDDSDFYHYPLVTHEEHVEKKKDWVKIGAIIAAVVGGAIAALAVLCILKFLPFDLLGGTLGIGITLITGLAILAPAAYILIDRWRNPQKSG